MYIPDKGDIVWLDFNPQAGREQAGRRPTLTLSPKSYNQKAELAIFCPITNQAKGYPFEVELTGQNKVSGVVLSDQIRSLSWRNHNTDFICKANSDDLEEVIARIQALID